MGQGKSSIIDSRLYNPSEYDEVQSFNDERYGYMKLFINKFTNAKYAEISKTLNDESILEKRVDELSFRAQLEHPNMVKLLSFNSQKKDEFCSSFYKLGLFYEYFSNNLRTEISERQRVRAAYREGEIWYLLDSLLNVVYYLKTKNVNHNDIRPYNVIITQNGQVKLGEVFLHSQPLSSYSQLLGNTLDEYYISPQLYRSLKEYKAAPIFDANKSDVYSVGMTVLEAATLENVSNVCYDRSNFNIRSEEVNRLLYQVKNQYSYPLYSFLSKLLTEGETERASIEELINELNQNFVQSQKSTNISTIELLQMDNNIQGGTIAETTYVEEKVLRSANPARQSHTQEKIYEVPTTNYTATYQSPMIETTYQAPVVETTNYQNDDLNARIQAVLAMSRDTISKYGSSNINYTSTPAATYTNTTNITSVPTYTSPTYTQSAVYTPAPVTNYNTYTTTSYNPNLDAKASQIEARTYLNENTNNIEIKSYQPSENIEEVIKRSKRETEAPVSYNTYNTYNTYSANVEPVRSSQQFVSSSYTPLTTQYTFTNNTNNVASQPIEEVIKRSKKESYDVPITSNTYSVNVDPVRSSQQYVSTSYAPITTNYSYTNTYATQPIEEVVKRSKREVEVPVTQNTYSANVEPVRSSQQFVSSSYTPVNTNYTYTTNVVAQPEVSYTQSSYVPVNYNSASYTSNIPASGEYQTSTSSTMNFKTSEERDAYINKLLSDAKATYNPSGSANVNTNITYTAYVDGKPVDSSNSYSAQTYNAVRY